MSNNQGRQIGRTGNAGAPSGGNRSADAIKTLTPANTRPVSVRPGEVLAPVSHNSGTSVLGAIPTAGKGNTNQVAVAAAPAATVNPVAAQAYGMTVTLSLSAGIDNSVPALVLAGPTDVGFVVSSQTGVALLELDGVGANSSASVSFIEFYSVRGTAVAPTAIQLNDLIGSLYFGGSDGAGGGGAAGHFEFRAAENFDPTHQGVQFQLLTTDTVTEGGPKFRVVVDGKGQSRVKNGVLALDGGNNDGVGLTFATLPTVPTFGMLAAITDSSTAVWGAVIAGAGVNKVLAFYNGTNWTVAGK